MSGHQFRTVRGGRYCRPSMGYFGAAYVAAFVLWITAGDARPLLFASAVLGVTIFALVRWIERRRAERLRVVADAVAAARARREQRARHRHARARVG